MKRTTVETCSVFANPLTDFKRNLQCNNAISTTPLHFLTFAKKHAYFTIPRARSAGVWFSTAIFFRNAAFPRT